VAEAPAAVAGGWENPFLAPAGPSAAPSPEPIGAGAASLLVTSGPYAGRTFPLGEGTAVIGRDPQASVSFPTDPTTSRRHATIEWDGTAWVLRDQGSTNGSFVNGARVTEHVLQPGDLIRIGANEMRMS
jgi:pSer/pThr/pTyr-binding forkhead associated (FHA) protein